MRQGSCSGRGVGSAQPLLSEDRVERRRSKKLLAASFVLLLTLIMHWVQDECEKEDEGWGKLWAPGETTSWCPGLKSQPPQPQSHSGSTTHRLIRVSLINFCLLVQSQIFYTMQEKALWYWTLIYFAKKLLGVGCLRALNKQMSLLNVCKLSFRTTAFL